MFGAIVLALIKLIIERLKAYFSSSSLGPVILFKFRSKMLIASYIALSPYFEWKIIVLDCSGSPSTNLVQIQKIVDNTSSV